MLKWAGREALSEVGGRVIAFCIAVPTTMLAMLLAGFDNPSPVGTFVAMFTVILALCFGAWRLLAIYLTVALLCLSAMSPGTVRALVATGASLILCALCVGSKTRVEGAARLLGLCLGLGLLAGAWSLSPEPEPPPRDPSKTARELEQRYHFVRDSMRRAR